MSTRAAFRVAIGILLFILPATPAAADTGYTITAAFDADQSVLSGSARITVAASRYSGSRTLALGTVYDRDLRLVCTGLRVNGTAVQAVAVAGVISIPVPAGVDMIVIETDFEIRGIPESGGIFILDDNHRDGSWQAWYPRLIAIADDHASYDISFSAASGSLASAADSCSLEEGAGIMRWNMRSASARNVPLIYSPIFVEKRVRVGDTDLGLFFREGSELWADRLLSILAEVHAWYAGKTYGFGRPRLDVVLADEEYARGDFPPPLPVIRDRTADMAEEYGGVFVANYLRWQAAVELSRSFWAPRLPAETGAIPWLAEGLALTDAERYARDALLGGPSFENIRQFYLSVAGKADTRLSQSEATAEAAGIDPFTVLAQGKGSWVVGMLGAEMGRSAFEQFRQKLVDRGDAPIGAGEIRSLAKNAAGHSLADFFTAWVEGDGTVNYGIGKVDEDGGRLRVQVLNNGTASPAIDLLAVLADGSEKKETLHPTEKEQWVELAAGQKVISLRLDPDGTLPDVNRGDNFRSLAGSERIEQLYAIDSIWEIGELQVAVPARQDRTGRWTDFALTVTNRQDKTGFLGMRLTAMFPGGRNRGISRFLLELAPGETRTLHERMEIPSPGDGLMQVTAEYFPVYTREGYARIDRASKPALANYYAVEISPAK